MKLSDKALLVHVQISQWTGRKFDKRATETVKTSHHTDKHAGNFTKKLLPGSKELERIGTLAGQIRKFFYEETLPWMSDGARIIKGDQYLPFTREFTKRQNEFNGAVDKFLAVYPHLRDAAKNSLGDLYSPDEYPEVTRLSRKFNCDVQVMPMPDADDFRTDISDEDRKKFVETMIQVERDAIQDVWNRIHEVVETAAQKLADPSGKFKDSLIGNVEETCELIPRLNVTDDKNLETVTSKLAKVVESIDTESIRKNSKDRQNAADALKDILKSMGPFMGNKE